MYVYMYLCMDGCMDEHEFPFNPLHYASVMDTNVHSMNVHVYACIYIYAYVSVYTPGLMWLWMCAFVWACVCVRARVCASPWHIHILHFIFWLHNGLFDIRIVRSSTEKCAMKHGQELDRSNHLVRTDDSFCETLQKINISRSKAYDGRSVALCSTSSEEQRHVG